MSDAGSAGMDDEGLVPRSDGSLDAVRDELREFVAERDWEQFHDRKNLAMLLASEAGELVEVLRWVPNDAADTFVAIPTNRDRLRDEIADVAIALLMLADRADIDLMSAMRDKIVQNRKRYPVDKSRGSAERQL